MVQLVLIDPFEREVRAIEWDRKAGLADLIRDPQGGGSGLISVVYASGIDFICDDEGLYQTWRDPRLADDEEPVAWPAFTTSLFPHQALSGRVLVTSPDGQGGTSSPHLGVESIALTVKWDEQPAEPRFEIVTDPKALTAFFGW